MTSLEHFTYYSLGTGIILSFQWWWLARGFRLRWNTREAIVGERIALVLGLAFVVTTVCLIVV